MVRAAFFGRATVVAIKLCMPQKALHACCIVECRRLCKLLFLLVACVRHNVLEDFGLANLELKLVQACYSQQHIQR